MWLQLTKRDGQPILVNMAWIAEALPGGGGSVLVFDRVLGDNKRLAVEEPVGELAEALGAARTGKHRRL
ncbi:hypothetical protein [Mesorhizobium sp. CN2-181]|uniref:hypothetical protein n=1 Tax=Mesorhizobium yinganensis TaxID=3157707 RepID=UPI0032B7BB94